METKTAYCFGWGRELPDFRDIPYVPLAKTLSHLPASVDIRYKCPMIYDQEHLNSSTANALAAAFEFEQMRCASSAFKPSRLFIYYNGRNFSSDAGAAIRDGLKVLRNLGVCPETLWPYETRFHDKEPSRSCYNIAYKHRLIKYLRLSPAIDQMKACLTEGHPVVFGFTAYESFISEEVANTGLMTMPKENEEIVGGQAVMAAGYDDTKQAFIIRNSWGANWGMKGYFYMPYAYISHLHLAFDFWTLRSSER